MVKSICLIVIIPFVDVVIRIFQGTITILDGDITIFDGKSSFFHSEPPGMASNSVVKATLEAKAVEMLDGSLIFQCFLMTNDLRFIHIVMIRS